MILSLVCILMIRKFLSASMTAHVQIISCIVRRVETRTCKDFGVTF